MDPNTQEQIDYDEGRVDLPSRGDGWEGMTDDGYPEA